MTTHCVSTVTDIPPEAFGGVIVCGSHGGLYSGYCVAKAAVRGAILNDAGVGRDQAGISGLPYLENLAMAASTVANTSARIGDPEDMHHRGVISHVNGPAAACGVEPGMSCREATELLAACAVVQLDPPKVSEGRRVLELGGGFRIVLVDSASMVGERDIGAVIVTGSHGGLVGGNPARAIKVDAAAAVFNDAGGGIESVGVGRLAPLNERGIPAFTVSAASARIGEAKSTLLDGIISAANQLAEKHGASVGAAAQPVLEGWARTLTRR